MMNPAAFFVLIAAALPAEAEHLRFNRDIRPILSENCFHCHSQGKVKGGRSLDSFDGATADHDGVRAIVPGKPDDSELIARLNSVDPLERMPPPDSHRQVSPAQVEILARWISEGAKYEHHWAFLPPIRPAMPILGRTPQEIRNPIDAFVSARLTTSGLKPSPEARPETWLRRVSFDLIGLPPPLNELDDFLADIGARGELAYASVVDRLLASEHFGERLAIDWLDVARYADTHGFNNDSARSMWRWRDWVIESFNANKPYDQFLIEQLAGDLLPKPSLDQRLATGFGRNHVINSEGGIIEEEYRVEYVADRVRTTSMAWLGLSMECSRCHDHKFDPISQRDYYRMFAFFNSVPEHGEDGRVANAVPFLSAPTRDQSATLERNERELVEHAPKLSERRKAWRWRDQFKPLLEKEIAEANAAVPTKDLLLHLACESDKPKVDVLSFPGMKPKLVPGITGQAWVGDASSPLAKVEGKHIKFDKKTGVTIAFWLNPSSDNPHDVALLSNQSYSGVPEGAGYGKGQEIRLVDGELELRMNDRFPAQALRVVSVGAKMTPGRWRQVTLTYGGGAKAGNVRMFIDGREILTRIPYDGLFSDPSGSPYLLGGDGGKDSASYRGLVDEVRIFSRALTRDEVLITFRSNALAYALELIDKDALADDALDWVRDVVLDSTDVEWQEFATRNENLWEQHLKLSRNLPSVMVMADLPVARPSFVLNRGQYDAHGEPVEPGVPEKLLAPWPDGAPRNRLGLALWFTQKDHPLTSRVVVNRFWAQLFGTGLVKTLEEFGSQGEWPSHPELLDWLAREFVDGGWNVKSIYKTIVLSATYRQASAVTPSLLSLDPENRLLARGPRVRLPAELIRDQALAISGLLKRHVGGPSVFPYQPEGLYSGVVVGADYPGTKWVNSQGDDLYRRSLYTFWKRTAPQPAMLTFDVPEREFCIARRSRTNTPLQALVLLNEPTYLEASRQLAARMIREGGDSDRERITFGFRLATGRTPRLEESRVLTDILERFRAEFASDPLGVDGLLKVGSSALDATLSKSELASMTVVASMILNLDETITKN